MAGTEVIGLQCREKFEELRNETTKSLEAQVEAATQLLMLAQSSNDLMLECEIFIFLGRGHRLLDNAFKSISSLNKAYIIINYNFPHKNNILCQVYRELSNTYANSLKDHITAIDYSFKGYKLNIPELNPILLNNIGSNYNSMRQFGNAKLYLNKGIKLCCIDENSSNRKSHILNLAYLYHNLAENYFQSNDYNQAIDYFEKANEICVELLENDVSLIVYHKAIYIYSYNYYGLAKTYLIIGQIDKAIEELENGKIILKDSQQAGPISSLFLLEADILLKQNRYNEFEQLFKSSIEFCHLHDLFLDKDQWLKKKQKKHEDDKEFEQAYFVTKQIIENSQVIKNNHKEFNISQLLVKKEEEILELENKNRIMKIQKDELKQFAYIVTHDLKTPLSNISNFAGLFNKKFRDKIDEKGEEYLNYIIGSATNMASMLSDLLQYISFDKSYDTNYEPCNIEDSALAILKKHKIPKEQYKLNTGDINLVPIRQFHLEILFDNIIKNAIKFKKPDKAIFLEIIAQKKEDHYLFQISDNGIGIEDKYKSQIFEIFKRLNKNLSNGTGIGLSICKKIVQSYMGSIWVEDNQYQGATFAFKISNNR